MTEQWKRVAGYCYEVSDLGRVRHADTGRMKKPSVQKRGGYLAVHLYRNNKRKCFALHRLVALAFIPNPRGKPDVNHRDYNRQNCKASNLEWVTVQENIDHSRDNQARGERKGNARHTEDQVRKVKALIAEGWSTKDIALECNTHRPFVSKVRNGVIWSHI